MSLLAELEKRLEAVKLQSCCCLPLRTGAIIVGCLYVVQAVLGCFQIGTSNAGQSNGVSIVFGIIFIILALLLLFGVLKFEPKFMLPCIIAQLIFVPIGGIIMIIINLVTLSFIALGSTILEIAISVYLFIVASSYYLELRQGDANPSSA